MDILGTSRDISTSVDARVLNKNENVGDYQAAEDPLTCVQELLAELILNCDVIEVEENILQRLAESANVKQVLNKTYILCDINIQSLNTATRTTCFLINLANLMWIHSLLSKKQFSNSENCCKNWLDRGRDFIGICYNVGKLGIVSLFDLHSVLLNFPKELKLQKFDAFAVIDDPRIVFTLAMPDLCTPRVKVYNTDNFELELETAYREYLQTHVTVCHDMSLLIPSTVLWYLEEAVYKTESGESGYNSVVSSTLQEKMNLLAEILRECGLPYFEIINRDIYFLSEAKSSVKFTYTDFEKEEMQLCDRRLWKSCYTHRSLLCCLQHYVMIICSMIVDENEHCSECNCDVASSERRCCVSRIMLNLHQFLHIVQHSPLMSGGSYRDSIQCVIAIASFLANEPDTCDTNVATDNDKMDYESLLNVICSSFISVPTSVLCDKINFCRKMALVHNDVLRDWHTWFDIFNADPNKVMNSLVEHCNVQLANQWFSIQRSFDQSFNFDKKVYAKYVDLICEMRNASALEQALKEVDGAQLMELIDYMIKNQSSVMNVSILVATSMQMDSVPCMYRTKLEALALGLRMISYIPVSEQAAYMGLVYKPMLVIEQFLLMERLSILETVIKEISSYISYLPEHVQEIESISRSRIDELLRVYASKALILKQTEDIHTIQSHMPSRLCDDAFIPPVEPPDMKKWVPNKKVESCMCCSKLVFTVFSRRHHCRRCGRVVCSPCSKHRCKVEGYETLVRICDQCYKYENQPTSPDLGQIQPMHDTDSSSCSSIIIEDEEEEKEHSEEVTAKLKLTLDERHNESIRQQFQYRNTPSVSLCLSILDLHTNHVAVPRFLFSRCEAFTRLLRTRDQSNEQRSLDCTHISRIIRSLLLATKVYFAHLGLLSGIQQCEELSTEVELMDRLATVNFTGLVPGRPVRGIVELRRIRDWLLSQQHWDLALEISTKAGLECNGIWFAWGKRCLKSGDWDVAREKFSRSSLERNPALLEDILRILCEEHMTNETDTMGKASSNDSVNIALPPDTVYYECLYYLYTYGTASQVLSFYMRYNQLKIALEYCLKQNVPPEVFLDKVYLTCLKAGCVTTLLQSMQEFDKSLRSWKEHLRLVCAYCDRKNHLKILYTIQLWLKDYVRVAMTSIRFYLQGAHSYSDLLTNSEHLRNACEHLETALKQTEGNELAMVLDKSEIEKHINTLCMQLEVTEEIGQNSACASLQRSPLPTLFGTQAEKINLISLIFEALSEIKSAFTISQRLVTEYAMNSATVYGKASENLVRLKREGAVVELIKCVRERVSDPDRVIDEVVSVALKAKPNQPEVLISYVTDNLTKMSLYMECGLLKSAYLLAVKHNRLDVVKKISVEAEKLKLFAIQRICQQKLNKINDQL